MPEVGGGMV